jgi:hypothetical protein
MRQATRHVQRARTIATMFLRTASGRRGHASRTSWKSRLCTKSFGAKFDFNINFNSPPNTLIITTRFPMFDCPSDSPQATGHPVTGGLKSNYGVNWGSWSFRQQGGPTNGVFPLNYGATLAPSGISNNQLQVVVPASLLSTDHVGIVSVRVVEIQLESLWFPIPQRLPLPRSQPASRPLAA